MDVSIYIHIWYLFWEWEKATFTAFPHFRQGTSGARSENLRPVLKSGLWRGNVVSNLLTSGHCKVVFSPFFDFMYGFFSFQVPQKIQVSQKRKDLTTKCIKNFFLVLWRGSKSGCGYWFCQFLFVCLLVCLFLTICQFRKRKMVQSWFQKLFWNQDYDVVSNLVVEIAICNFDLFHSALMFKWWSWQLFFSFEVMDPT